MKKHEHFLIDTVEELKEAYNNLSENWTNTLAREIAYFERNKDCQKCIAKNGLGELFIIKAEALFGHGKQIPSPLKKMPNFREPGVLLDLGKERFKYRCLHWGDSDLSCKTTFNDSAYYSYGYTIHKGEIYILIDRKIFKSGTHYMVKEIDLINFYKTKNMTNSKFPFRLTSENAHKIINCACASWEEKLAREWGANMILGKPNTVTEEFYKEMLEASNPTQKEVLDSIFGVEDKYFDFSSLNVNSTLAEINKVLGFPMRFSFRAFGDFKSKGFYLDDSLNWSIKTDNQGVQVLVPTKK